MGVCVFEPPLSGPGCSVFSTSTAYSAAHAAIQNVVCESCLPVLMLPSCKRLAWVWTFMKSFFWAFYVVIILIMLWIFGCLFVHDEGCRS
jgi:hypothetical protein